MDLQVFYIYAVTSMTIVNLMLVFTTPLYLPYLPGTIDRPQMPILYRVDIFSPRFFMVVIWSTGYLGTIIFHIWWSKIRSTKNLPNLTIYHLGWIGGQVTWTIFIATFLYAKFFYFCTDLLVMNVCFGFVTYGALKHRSEVQKKLTASQFLWYDILAIQLAPMFLTWTQHVITFLAASGLGYHGPINQPTLTGLCDPRTTCGTVFLPGLVLLFIGWVILDIYLYPSHTKHIKSVYPTFCYNTISILSVKNRMWDGELRLNQWIYIGIAVVSMVIWMFRGLLQTKLGKKEIKEE